MLLPMCYHLWNNLWATRYSRTNQSVRIGMQWLSGDPWAILTIQILSIWQDIWQQLRRVFYQPRLRLHILDPLNKNRLWKILPVKISVLWASVLTRLIFFKFSDETFCNFFYFWCGFPWVFFGCLWPFDQIMINSTNSLAILDGNNDIRISMRSRTDPSRFGFFFSLSSTHHSLNNIVKTFSSFWLSGAIATNLTCADQALEKCHFLTIFRKRVVKIF